MTCFAFRVTTWTNFLWSIHIKEIRYIASQFVLNFYRSQNAADGHLQNASSVWLRLSVLCLFCVWTLLHRFHLGLLWSSSTLVNSSPSLMHWIWGFHGEQVQLVNVRLDELGNRLQIEKSVFFLPDDQLGRSNPFIFWEQYDNGCHTLNNYVALSLGSGSARLIHPEIKKLIFELARHENPISSTFSVKVASLQT